MQDLIKKLLEKIGEDPKRQGLLQTPKRVAESLAFLTKGYSEDPLEAINDAIFEENHNEMVLVKDVDFYSMCEHHLLPFFGKAHIAYIPQNKIIGLSKLPRLVDIFARRLQVQERLTRQVALSIQEHLNPQGVAVIMEAQHLCMMMRGVEKQNSITTTSCMLGVFQENSSTRNELLSLVSHQSRIL